MKKILLNSIPIRKNIFVDRALLERREDNDNLLLTNTVAHEMFLLNKYSAEVWNMCDGENTVGDIISYIHQQYGITEKIIQIELNKMLVNFYNNNLLEFK